MNDTSSVEQVSLSQSARDWIEALPADTWFRSSAVPGPRHVVRKVLNRLVADEKPIIGRFSPGIYWRQRPLRDECYGIHPMLDHLAHSVIAPQGSGYAGICALHHIGWTTQVPVKTTIAVPYRNLTVPDFNGSPSPRFVERHNKRRRKLNWNEATLLEAALHPEFANYATWEEAMWSFNWATGWIKQGLPIRKKIFLWAAQGEPQPKKSVGVIKEWQSFDALMARLEADLPNELNNI